ncbi:hypothetical protein VHEMI09178 [[Torrubiella] hemipterigena]|uniref:Peptidase S1A alpha-lytic prodomain domain-containing protein n=1 Tax=[Torrubiella] hemipterigena TaxID=1531966 RepID=A0A0A1TPJ9_9HYPO|nr:hypothetical protein VHEMI09178 [[Torrubiella] hemipterigena]
MELTKFLSFLAIALPVAYGAPAEAATTLHPNMLKAMKRDLGLDAKQAVARIAEDLQASKVLDDLSGSLGPAFAGGWIDAGKSFVGVTDQAMAQKVTAAGATPVVMINSLSRLNEAKTAIDNKLKGHQTRADAGSITGVAAYYVDVAANKVVFEALAANHGQAKDLAAHAGLSATEFEIRTVENMPTPRYNIVGGDPYNSIRASLRCSVGFSVTGGFISAGHCGSQGDGVQSTGGVDLGTFSGSSFPSVDMSYIKTLDSVTLTGYVNDYNGGSYSVSGGSEAAVGANICRSGQTTGVHCGTIKQKDVTVNYAEGTIYGLTQTSACSDHGDSGGSFLAGTQAQGVLSGGNGNCNNAGISYFQPLGPILSTYGVSLILA